MLDRRHIPSLLLCSLLLTQCQSAKKTADALVVMGPQLGLVQTEILMMQMSGTATLPSAPLGLFVANYLIDSSGIHITGAENGVNTGLGILNNTAQQTSTSFAVLEQLGVALQVNIPDMLNRSDDRQQALDAYIDTLTQTLQKSKDQLTALKQTQQQLLVTQHDKRTAVANVQHDLNTALQKQDYTTASAKQTEIVSAKSEQAAAESQVTQINSTIQLYTNLNAIAAKRLNAMTANRQALIAGIQVVNVPGIEELNVLKKGTTSNSANGSNIFGN